MSNEIIKKDSYAVAGVDIEKADQLVDWLSSEEKQKSNAGSVISGIGGFAGVFAPHWKKFEDPLLVASTDGVGTKLLLAIDNDQLSGVGVDLVAMCVNDLYCVGATPLFFLDYYATGVLDENQFKAVLSGIREGLRQSDTALLGGETAELPGLYKKGHFDLGGFVVGLVDRQKSIGAHRVVDGDVLIALPSSGFHSNGYSMIRYWLSQNKLQTKKEELIERLLIPTTIYGFLPSLLEDMGVGVVHAFANITGGGISGNLSRVIPGHLKAFIKRSEIQTPLWMREFIDAHVDHLDEVEHVFNMGVGMIAIVAKDHAQQFLKKVNERSSLQPTMIGSVRKSESLSGERVCYE